VTDFLAEWTGKVFVGDCLDFMAQLPSGCVDAVITDPPFLAVFGTTEDRNDIGNFSIIEGWWREISRELLRLTAPGGLLFVFCDWRTYPAFWRGSLGVGWEQRNLCVWTHMSARNYGVFRFCHQLCFVASQEGFMPHAPAGSAYDVWDISQVPTQERRHPTEKPESLLLRCAETTQPGDLIFDPFLGSGTTAVVAERLGRRWCGSEINESYAEMATKRILRAREQLVLPIEPKPAPGIFKHEQASLGVVE